MRCCKILHTVSKNFSNQTINDESKKEKNIKTKVLIKNTEIDVPFKVKIDNFQILSKIITFDSNRNKLIIDDIIKEASDGNKCLILTERKEHVEVLSYYLKGNYEIITLTGELTEKQKNEKLKQIEAGNFQIIIATGQLIGEGTDFPNLNSLFLVYPFSFKSKLIQYIGRIQRGQNSNSTIYDCRLGVALIKMIGQASLNAGKNRRYFKAPKITDFTRLRWMSSYTAEMVEYKNKVFAEKLRKIIREKNPYDNYIKALEESKDG